MLPILLVEDDDDIREGMAELLRGEGYAVHPVVNGKEALDYLQRAEREPCLILLDLMMPIVDGWQVVEVLRAADRVVALPVVVMSAVDPAAAPAGTIAFVRKPVDFDLLLGLVHRYCEAAPNHPC